MPDFLLELFSEEIPARMQESGAAALRDAFAARLAEREIRAETWEACATPRRIMLHASGLPQQQPDRSIEARGPRVGAPEAALAGFLRAAGLDSVAQCEVRDTGKGSFYFAQRIERGGALGEVLAALIPEVLDKMPWPKSMRWAGHGVRWVRPLHNILAIIEDGTSSEIVPARWLLDRGVADPVAITANDVTFGHRFMTAAPVIPAEAGIHAVPPPRMPEAPGSDGATWIPASAGMTRGRGAAPIEVTGFADYRAKLASARVMLRAEDRKAAIRSDGARLAAEHGLRVKDDPALLDEVAGLVEWPVVRLGRIEERFMALPPELLTTSMRTHQKYFACETPEGVLAPFFVVVGNNEPRDGGVQMVLGNERVLRARLSDAQFFWDQDRRKPLADRTGQLGTRVFHAKLGTVAAKVERMAALARSLAHSVDGAGRDDVERAVRLAKADLSSALVGEFPELQGIVGRYLALADGEKPTVAEAIARHYAPAGLADQTPTAPLDVVVALADRLDTLAGFFAIGEIPTGTKDPYALRRAALGVIRIVLENGLRLPLRGPLFIALRLHGLPDCDEGRVIASLLDFIADRLKVVLRERGFRHDLISAVWALGDADDLVRLVARVAALRDFLGTEDGASLLVAYRRAAKIVQIEEKKDGVSYGDLPPDHDAFTLVEEQVLFRQLTVAGELSDVALAEENYGAAMSALASLRWPLDAFFTDVTVNTGEPAVRANRLRLLARIRQAFDRVADFSKIEG